MKTVVLDHLRHTRAYGFWRLWRERQQVTRFARILRELDEGSVYSEGKTKALLAERAGARRRMVGRPRIVAFGTRDWEDKGLWQAFQRVGDFALFDYLERAVSSGSAEKRRAELGREFIKYVEEQEHPNAPVQLAFFYASGIQIDPAMLHELGRRGIWTVVLSLDDKQQLPERRHQDLAGWQLEAALAADLYWTTWRTGADWLLARGARPWYSPGGADADLFRPMPVPRDLDVLWVGRGYGPRYELVRWLRRQGFDVRAFGPGWDGGMLPFEKMVELYSRAKVVLGMGGVGQTDEIKHLKGRDFEVPMSGAVYLTSFNPELADHFVIGREILCYSSLSECADTLHWILVRPDLADSIRKAARERCVADHAWQRRIGQLFILLSAE